MVQFDITISSNPPLVSVPSLNALQWLDRVQLVTATSLHGSIVVLFNTMASSPDEMSQSEMRTRQQESMSMPSLFWFTCELTVMPRIDTPSQQR
jgi:hypothetical protein